MRDDCDHDDLDALATDGHVPDRARVDVHLARCPDCARELAWLRAERALFDGRALESPDTERLWDGVAARLPPPPSRVAPYRVAAAPPPPPRRRPWRAFAAGALAAAVALVGVAALTLRVDTAPMNAYVGTAALPDITSLRVETRSADVRVTAVDARRVEVTVRGARVTPRVSSRGGGRYEVTFDGHPLGQGVVELRAPRGVALEVVTRSGDVAVHGGGAATHVTTASGDVTARGVGDIDVTTASGDVALDDVRGDARVHTASGSVGVAALHAREVTYCVGNGCRNVEAAPHAREVTLETTSGDVSWSGSCGRGCRLLARTTSGDVRLVFGEGSGFEARFTTVSGELDDALGTGLGASGRWGDGAGSVDVRTTSGRLSLARR